jgi:hypothetical protein
MNSIGDVCLQVKLRVREQLALLGWAFGSPVMLYVDVPDLLLLYAQNFILVPVRFVTSSTMELRQRIKGLLGLTES